MWWQFAVDFLFPPGCVHCGRDFAVDGCRSSVEGLCCNCLDCLSDADQPICYRCAGPVGPNIVTTAGCGLCSHETFAFERVFALGVYSDALRKACVATKGAFSAPLAAALTRATQQRCGAEVQELGIQLVVPVPHHWMDRIRRPHLPPVTMANEWSRFLKVPCHGNILTKTHRTAPQALLSPAKRRSNLNNAFHVSGRANLDGLRVLVVDDVVTTGSTVHRLAKRLKSAGAAEVFVAAVARGVGSDRLSRS